MAQSSETKLNKIFDQDVQITGNLTVDGNLVGFSGDNFYLDGITKSGNTLTFSVNGTTNQTYTFGSAAFANTTAFAAASHTHSYLPLSGGTLTGNFSVTGDIFGYWIYLDKASNNNGIHIYAASGGKINWDARDFSINSDTGARIHKWNRNVANTVYLPYYENWYDGNSYHTIGVENNKLYFDGSEVIHAGNIGSQSVSYATSAGNADTVDGYHASNLWRSDGAAWNPSANVILNQSANSQEWSFDINRNGYSGGYWQVWDSSNSTMLKVDAVNGKVYAPYNFVGNLEGNASSASSVAWSNVSSKPAGWLSTTNLITNSSPNATAFPSGFYEHSDGNNTPTGTWFNYINVRHSNVGNGHGYQLGMSYYDNNLWFRSYKGGTSPTFESWETALATGGSNQTKSGYLQSNSSLRAPVFYDSNNTNWWIDPNASSSAKFRQFVQIGDSSSYNTNSGSWGARLNVTDDVHARIDVAQDANGMHSYWYAHTGQSSIKFGTTSNHGVEFVSNNSGRGRITSGGTLEWWNNVTGRIYYDYDNTAYFLDPTNTSYLKGLSIESGNVIMRNSRTLSVSGDPDTFYPVVFSHSATSFALEIRKHVHNYQTWDGRLAARIKSWSSTWGGDQGYAYVEENAYTTRQYIAKVSQSSGPNNYLVVWLRGSRSYNVYTTPYDSVGTPYYSSTDLGSSNGTVSPTTTATLPYIRFHTNSSGSWVSTTQIHAPAFYDYNNTAYYIDPDSTGTSIKVRGTIENPSIWINDGDNYNGYSENIRLFNPVNNGPSVIAFGASGISGTPVTSILGYSDRLEQRFGSNWQERVRNGYVEASGSYRAPIFYDSNNTGYYLDPASTSNLNVVQAKSIRNDGSVSSDDAFGIYWESSGSTAYAIYRESGGWSNPFPDLRISFHTGIKLGANANYNGIRFYDDHQMNTIVASINDGDSNLRGYYDIIAYASDKRLKTNIEPINNAVDKVKSLQGMTYNWNEVGNEYGWKPSKEREVGVFAQDVQEVLPEAVKLAPFDQDHDTEGNMYSKSGENFLTVKYEKLVPLLIEAIKEQQKQIDELKKIINP